VKPRAALAIAAGGACGAAVRWLTFVSLGHPGGFPWVTFAINVLGSALLAGVVVHARARWPHRPSLLDGLAIGFCGGLTTFSTFAVECASLGRQGRTGLAVVYLVTSVVAGVTVAWIVGQTERRVIRGAE
jgi:fluoride exporter